MSEEVVIDPLGEIEVMTDPLGEFPTPAIAKRFRTLYPNLDLRVR